MIDSAVHFFLAPFSLICADDGHSLVLGIRTCLPLWLPHPGEAKEKVALSSLSSLSLALCAAPQCDAAAGPPLAGLNDRGCGKCGLLCEGWRGLLSVFFCLFVSLCVTPSLSLSFLLSLSTVFLLFLCVIFFFDWLAFFSVCWKVGLFVPLSVCVFFLFFFFVFFSWPHGSWLSSPI